MWKDCETELDYLDFDYLVSILNSVIRDDSLLPSSIGVYGDWGSGKSSLLKMSSNELEKDEGTLCLFFNGWLFEGYEDAKTAILGSVLDAIKENRTFSEKAKCCFHGLMASVDKFKLAMTGAKVGASLLLGGGIPSLAAMSLNSVISSGLDAAAKTVDDINEDQISKIKQNISDELNNTKLRENIREFQDNFEELLRETKISRLVVYIDELDRCSPDTILDTLEAIRLFLFKGKVAFVIGADERHIQYAVKRKFKDIQGIEYDIGKEYLEKLVQYPIKIPRLDAREVEFYIACLFLEKSLRSEYFRKLIAGIRERKQTEFDAFVLDNALVEEILPTNSNKDAVKEGLTVARQLSFVLAAGLYGNPRQCKRFLNSLAMREEMANAKGSTLNRGVLAKIMMLEHFRPEKYRILSQYHAEGTLKDELQTIENKGIENANLLKDWSGDVWLSAWIKNEPHLAGVDLRPYFYFTRDALSVHYSSNVRKLSPQAQEIFKKLCSKSEALVTAAVSGAKDLTDQEAVEILNAIFVQTMNEESINNNNLLALVRFGSSRTCLYNETLTLFKSISKEKIKPAHVVRFKEFGDLSGQKHEVMEWLLSMNFTNKAIRRELGQED
jgi:predicted KAP-like P-loop ATPase